MTRRERLKKLLERRKQREQIIVVDFVPAPGSHPIRPLVIGGTPAQRDAILAKWDAEHPNVPPRPTGRWTKAPECSPGTAPMPATASQRTAGVPTVHDRPVGDISAPSGAPASSTRATCHCGALGEAPAGGFITCRSCGAVFCA
jgi:hypothetical protein